MKRFNMQINDRFGEAFIEAASIEEAVAKAEATTKGLGWPKSTAVEIRLAEVDSGDFEIGDPEYFHVSVRGGHA